MMLAEHQKLRYVGHCCADDDGKSNDDLNDLYSGMQTT